MNNKNGKDSFGLKNSPIDPISSLGNFYAGLGSKRKKPLFLRIMLVIFFAACFVLPGLFLMLASFGAYAEGGVMSMLMPLTIGLVLALAGAGGTRTALKG